MLYEMMHVGAMGTRWGWGWGWGRGSHLGLQSMMMAAISAPPGVLGALATATPKTHRELPLSSSWTEQEI